MTAGLNGHLSESNGGAGQGGDSRLANLRAVVLLAGSVRPNNLSLATGRSPLDLPVDGSGSTVLSLWQQQTEALAEVENLDRLPLRIVIDNASHDPTIPAPVRRTDLSVERDSHDFRGTGGLLRDLAVSYAANDLLLVANAAQILIDPLPGLARVLFDAGGSVSFIGHRDGTPCGLFLVRCDVLATIREIGFLDFKEQVLPKLEAVGHHVSPVMRDAATAVPIRTLGGYLSGLRAFARLRAGEPRVSDPFGEDWFPTFAIREQGAVVHSAATIHDSVVLNGATVHQGGVVVRSVIGPGAVVEAGDTIADAAVGAAQPVSASVRRGTR